MRPQLTRGVSMPLTPADVHNVAFKKPPIGKRGYDEEEVDAFLDEVERELARLSRRTTSSGRRPNGAAAVAVAAAGPTRASRRSCPTSRASSTGCSVTRSR